MSTFDDQFTATVSPCLVATFGDTNVVTFGVTGGDTQTVDAIVGGEEVGREPDREGRRQQQKTRSVIIQVSDLSRSSIVQNEAVTVDDQKYRIVHLGSVEGGAYEVQLRAVLRSEIARDNYRSR